MLLTKNEMEVLCIFYAGSLSATKDALQGVLTVPGQTHPRIADIETLLEKLSRMTDGDLACLAFEVTL